MRKEIEEERNKTLDASNSPATVGNRKVDQAEWSDVAGRARSGRGRERVSVIRVDEKTSTRRSGRRVRDACSRGKGRRRLTADGFSAFGVL